MNITFRRHFLGIISLIAFGVGVILLLTLQFNLISAEGANVSDTNSIIHSLNNGSKSVHISAGTYDFGGSIITLKNSVSITGDGADKSIIKDLCIIAPYGIEIDGVGFAGGATTQIQFAGGTVMNKKVIIFSKPAGSNINLSYKNCSFTGADFASFICDTAKIGSDIAENCVFNNIAMTAIYHSVNSSYSKYVNNEFANIGDGKILYGCVSGIWIGDVTGNSNVQSDNVIIENNYLHDMRIGEDKQLTRHAINANFICVRAEKAIINKNTIKNVYGFGEDREAVYTKVKKLEVTNNIIENGGYGEGYITCKGQGGENLFSLIQGNKLSGTYGSGIYIYGPGTIKENTIAISKCKTVIVSHSRSAATDEKLTIEGNVINCDAGYYYIDGNKASNYNPGAMIFTDLKQCEFLFINNKITSMNSKSPWSRVLDIVAIKKNITIEGNAINVASKTCLGLLINSGEDYSAFNKDITIQIKNNQISTGDSALRIGFGNTKGISSKRKYIITGNDFNSSDNDKSIIVNGGENNKDTLIYDRHNATIQEEALAVSDIKSK